MAIKEKDLPVSGSYGPGVYVRTVSAGGASQKTGFGDMKEALNPTIDSALSTSSTNPVQNKVITGAVNDLKEVLETKLPFFSKTAQEATRETDIPFPYTNKCIHPNSGQPVDSNGDAVSDFIDLTDVTGIYRYGTTIRFGMTPYAFYDESKNYISGSYVSTYTDYDIVNYNGKQVTWLNLSLAPQNARYIRIEWQMSRPYIYVCVKSTYGYFVDHLVIGGIEPFKFYGKKIINFGDSIFGNYRDTNDTTDKSISKMIADATGATVYNAGFGGCRMGPHTGFWNAFSMHSLADSIASNSWTVQENALVSGSGSLPSYFSDTVAMLKNIDFSEIDFITIGYGVNDYTGNVFIYGTEATFTNVWDYFIGALKYSLETILNAYPNIRIIVITPCWLWVPNSDTGLLDYSSDDAASSNTRGYKLTDYVEACKTVCEAYHVPYIDTYNELGFNPYSYKAYFYVKGVDGAVASDGTHPKLAGRQLRADRIIGQMESFY